MLSQFRALSCAEKNKGRIESQVNMWKILAKNSTFYLIIVAIKCFWFFFEFPYLSNITQQISLWLHIYVVASAIWHYFDCSQVQDLLFFFLPAHILTKEQKIFAPGV